MLTAHQTSGEKTQSHDHYLKGSLYCGQCGSRLTLTNAKSRRGVIYPYFMCTGRHARRTNCERKSMFVPDIEAAVEDYYRHVQIPEHVVTALRELVTSEFDRLHQVAKHEAQGYKAERDALRDERTKLMQAHYAGAVPLDLLGTEHKSESDKMEFLAEQGFPAIERHVLAKDKLVKGYEDLASRRPTLDFEIDGVVFKADKVWEPTLPLHAPASYGHMSDGNGNTLVIENAGLTEWPVPLLGRFDEAFLEVPPEVIQLTARVNQKYFVVNGADGKLANGFICTANIDASDGGAEIVAGNRKVLAARRRR